MGVFRKSQKVSVFNFDSRGIYICIFRKGQKVSAFNFDSKGILNGAPRDPDP